MTPADPTSGADPTPGTGPRPEVDAPDRAEAPDPAGATAARPPQSRWWRGAAAALVLAGLVWGASAVDGGSLGRSEPSPGEQDAGAASVGPSAVTLVDSAALACPGIGTDEVPVQVVAARAPATVLTGDAGAAPSDGGTDADDAAVTTSPGVGARDDAAVTTSPGAGAGHDAAVTTSPPRPSEDDDDADDEGDGTGSDGDARLVLSGGADGGRPVPAAEPLTVDLDDARAAFVLGQGGAAPGLVGAQLGVGTQAGSRGASLAPCVQPADETWLVGGDGRAGGTERLVLSNPGTEPVTAQVRVWGADGEVATTGAGGLVVPAGGRVERLLDALAPGAELPVVSVTATGGPVSAHLHLLVRDGTTDLGSGAVAPGGTQVPATDLVVPAPPPAPEGSEHRVALRVLAPGDEEAVVDLTALTEEGAVRLPDLVTRVAAGRTVEIDLAGLPAGTTGLRVRADAAVVAAAGLEISPAEGEPEETSRDDADATAAPAEDADATAAPPDDADATGSPPDDDLATSTPGGDDAGTTADPRPSRDEPLVRPAGELAWVAAGAPSTVPVGTALPDPGVVPDGTSRLVVSAVDATTATVHWLDEEGEVTTEVLDLANDTGRGLTVPADARAVWVTTTDRQGEGPGAGVVAAVHVTGVDGRGPLVASATLPEVPWTRTVTTVRPAVP